MTQQIKRMELPTMTARYHISEILIAKMIDTDHEREEIKDTSRRFIRVMMKT